MFTGDRVENGTSVALACGLMRQQHQMFFITNDQNKKTIQDKIAIYSKQIKNSILVVDGTCLETILQSQGLMNAFFRVCMRAPGLCLCRCTPTQKTEMTKLLKKYSGQKIIAAIGDGDNDAGMLYEADLGITVSEKNDQHPSLCSDI